jgi:hypothetical protein
MSELAFSRSQHSWRVSRTHVSAGIAKRRQACLQAHGGEQGYKYRRAAGL